MLMKSDNLINGFNYTADSIRLLHLPLTTTVYDGNGNKVAQTVNEYDNYTNDLNHAPLQDYASVTQHDMNYGATYTTRGNLTRAGQWVNLTDSFIYNYPRYDKLGNVVSAKDANGNVTSISFADDFGTGLIPGGGVGGSFGQTYALPTLITSPPPTPGAPVQTARSQYDFSTGLLTGFKDRNGIITQTFYNDPFNRPTLVKAALGVSGVEAHAAMFYAPATIYGVTLASNDMLTAKDQTTWDDAVLRSWTKTDGFGRTAEAWSRDPQGDVKVHTIYDGLGRSKQVSNPYRPLSEAPTYTTTGYDLAGRVTSVTTVADNAVVTTAYDSDRVLVSDQAGRKRISKTDALGRLKEVWEVAAADPATEAVSFPGFPDVAAGYRTTYGYDTLDNLTSVIQGTQPARSFAYDSLKRLTSATNPESGMISYQYDDNGNLLIKTDARGVSAHYEYDALNRVKRRWYNGSSSLTDVTHNVPTLPSGVGASDEAKYFYDSQSIPGAPTFNRGFAAGRLVAVTYGGGSAGDYFGFDALGRAKLKIQQTGGINYQTERTYNLAGGVTTQKYPSLRTVTYNYDNAGRLADKDAQNPAFSGNLGDGAAARTYTTGITYAAGGQMKQEQFGTDVPVYNKLFYNSRQQLAEILTGTTANDSSWNRGKIVNDYSLQCTGAGCNATDNNGNLRKQTVSVPNNEQNTNPTWWYQQYDYDSLNRLQRVKEHDSGANQLWQQEYVYDRWGNRTIHQTNTWGTGIPKPNFSLNPANNNRLTVPGGYTMSYDGAGNVVNDTYTGQGQRTYDAENRMKQAWANGQWQTYSYDGDGRRVKRNVNGVETWQVYGLGGELLAEYAQNADRLSPQKEYGYRNGQLLITAESTSASAPAPSALTANPPSSGANVTLNWTAASGATNYRVERKGAGGTFGSIGTTSSTNMIDNGAGSGSAYLYKVCAADGAGNCTSGYSNVVLGATFNFPTDSTLTTIADDPSGTTVTSAKLEHITELRTAVNAVRSLAGLSAASWAHPTLTRYVSVISKDDVQELRTKLDEALTALGIQTSVYDDGTLAGAPNGTLIKGIHIRQLRQRATSGLGGSGGGGGTGFSLQWLVADHLGTPRMIIDQTGALANVKRHDYLPFGEELVAGIGGRTIGQGYVGDNNRFKFTTYERDAETGLDYAQARYYASTQGRFTSVDPHNAGAYPDYPQSWNAYTYARNNPLLYVDPDGLDVRTHYNGGGGRWYTEKEFAKYKRELESQGLIVRGGRIFSPVYDDDGNAIGVRQIGTYASDMNDFGQGVSAELARRNPAMQRFGRAGVAYLSLFALPASEGALMVGWLGRSLATAEAAAPAGAAAVTALIQNAGMLTTLRNGVQQGFVHGNPQQIFNALAEGGTKLPSGAVRLADGTFVRLYKASSTGEPTIWIQRGAQQFKMRVIP